MSGSGGGGGSDDRFIARLQNLGLALFNLLVVTPVFLIWSFLRWLFFDLIRGFFPLLLVGGLLGLLSFLFLTRLPDIVEPLEQSWRCNVNPGFVQPGALVLNAVANVTEPVSCYNNAATLSVRGLGVSIFTNVLGKYATGTVFWEALRDAIFFVISLLRSVFLFLPRFLVAKVNLYAPTSRLLDLFNAVLSYVTFFCEDLRVLPWIVGRLASIQELRCTLENAANVVPSYPQEILDYLWNALQRLLALITASPGSFSGGFAGFVGSLRDPINEPLYLPMFARTKERAVNAILFASVVPDKAILTLACSIKAEVDVQTIESQPPAPGEALPIPATQLAGWTSKSYLTEGNFTQCMEEQRAFTFFGMLGPLGAAALRGVHASIQFYMSSLRTFYEFFAVDLPVSDPASCIGRACLGITYGGGAAPLIPNQSDRFLKRDLQMDLIFDTLRTPLPTTRRATTMSWLDGTLNPLVYGKFANNYSLPEQATLSCDQGASELNPFAPVLDQDNLWCAECRYNRSQVVFEQRVLDFCQFFDQLLGPVLRDIPPVRDRALVRALFHGVLFRTARVALAALYSAGNALRNIFSGYEEAFIFLARFESYTEFFDELQGPPTELGGLLGGIVDLFGEVHEGLVVIPNIFARLLKVMLEALRTLVLTLPLLVNQISQWAAGPQYGPAFLDYHCLSGLECIDLEGQFYSHLRQPRVLVHLSYSYSHLMRQTGRTVSLPRARGPGFVFDLYGVPLSSNATTRSGHLMPPTVVGTEAWEEEEEEAPDWVRARWAFEREGLYTPPLATWSWMLQRDRNRTIPNEHHQQRRMHRKRTMVPTNDTIDAALGSEYVDLVVRKYAVGEFISTVYAPLKYGDVVASFPNSLYTPRQFGALESARFLLSIQFINQFLIAIDQENQGVPGYQPLALPIDYFPDISEGAYHVLRVVVDLVRTGNEAGLSVLQTIVEISEGETSLVIFKWLACWREDECVPLVALISDVEDAVESPCTLIPALFTEGFDCICGSVNSIGAALVNVLRTAQYFNFGASQALVCLIEYPGGLDRNVDANRGCYTLAVNHFIYGTLNVESAFAALSNITGNLACTVGYLLPLPCLDSLDQVQTSSSSTPIDFDTHIYAALRLKRLVSALTDIILALFRFFLGLVRNLLLLVRDQVRLYNGADPADPLDSLQPDGGGVTGNTFRPSNLLRNLFVQLSDPLVGRAGSTTRPFGLVQYAGDLLNCLFGPPFVCVAPNSIDMATNPLCVGGLFIRVGNLTRNLRDDVVNVIVCPIAFFETLLIDWSAADYGVRLKDSLLCFFQSVWNIITTLISNLIILVFDILGALADIIFPNTGLGSFLRNAGSVFNDIIDKIVGFFGDLALVPELVDCFACYENVALAVGTKCWRTCLFMCTCGCSPDAGRASWRVDLNGDGVIDNVETPHPPCPAGGTSDFSTLQFPTTIEDLAWYFGLNTTYATAIFNEYQALVQQRDDNSAFEEWQAQCSSNAKKKKRLGDYCITPPPQGVPLTVEQLNRLQQLLDFYRIGVCPYPRYCGGACANPYNCPANGDCGNILSDECSGDPCNTLCSNNKKKKRDEAEEARITQAVLALSPAQVEEFKSRHKFGIPDTVLDDIRNIIGVNEAVTAAPLATDVAGNPIAFIADSQGNPVTGARLTTGGLYNTDPCVPLLRRVYKMSVAKDYAALKATFGDPEDDQDVGYLNTGAANRHLFGYCVQKLNMPQTVQKYLPAVSKLPKDLLYNPSAAASVARDSLALLSRYINEKTAGPDYFVSIATPMRKRATAALTLKRQALALAASPGRAFMADILELVEERLSFENRSAALAQRYSTLIVSARDHGVLQTAIDGLTAVESTLTAVLNPSRVWTAVSRVVHVAHEAQVKATLKATRAYQLSRNTTTKTPMPLSLWLETWKASMTRAVTAYTSMMVARASRTAQHQWEAYVARSSFLGVQRAAVSYDRLQQSTGVLRGLPRVPVEVHQWLSAQTHQTVSVNGLLNGPECNVTRCFRCEGVDTYVTYVTELWDLCIKRSEGANVSDILTGPAEPLTPLVTNGTVGAFFVSLGEFFLTLNLNPFRHPINPDPTAGGPVGAYFYLNFAYVPIVTRCVRDVHTLCHFGYGAGWGLVAVLALVALQFGLWFVAPTVAGVLNSITSFSIWLVPLGWLIYINLFTAVAWGYNPICFFDPGRFVLLFLFVPFLSWWPAVPECAVRELADGLTWFSETAWWSWAYGLTPQGTAPVCPDALIVAPPSAFGLDTFGRLYEYAWTTLTSTGGLPSFTGDLKGTYFWTLFIASHLWVIPALIVLVLFLLWLWQAALLVYSALLNTFNALAALITRPAAIALIVITLLSGIMVSTILGILYA